MSNGSYAIERKIASGGAGTVYLAKKSGPGGFSRRVAIKRLHSHLNDDSKLRKILLKEARLASLLHHANVVPVVDVDESDGILGLVMEWVDGASLAELLASSRAPAEPMPTAVGVRILLDACAGLAAVHDLRDERGRPTGLLHCDVSPQNLLVGVDGVTRVADFGLAKITEVSMATSTAGLVAGKLGYVAPEILEGRPFSRASDLFALGVVGWEVLARRRVLDVATGGTRGVALAPPPPLSGLVPEIGDAFDEVVTRATLRDPAARFPSVRAFGESLEEAARRANALASSGDVARWVRARRSPRGDLARLRIASDGVASVDHSFAETAALGDEGTPPLPELETTDPITEETAPATSEAIGWTPPEETAEGRKTQRMDAIPPSRPIEAQLEPTRSEAPAALLLDDDGPSPVRGRGWGGARGALLAAPVLVVLLIAAWVSRATEPSRGAPPKAATEDGEARSRPIAAPPGESPRAPSAAGSPAPTAPPAAEVPSASQAPDASRPKEGAPKERTPARRPARGAPPATTPTAAPTSVVPPPPANPYRR